jgi:hypothetical protein
VFLSEIIRKSANTSKVGMGAFEDEEFADPYDLVEAYVFADKLLKLSNLIAITALAIGFVHGTPWWGAFLAATIIWFASLFCIAVLCAPPNNGACHVRIKIEDVERDGEPVLLTPFN